MEETQHFLSEVPTRSPTGAVVSTVVPAPALLCRLRVHPWAFITSVDTVALCPVSLAASSAVGPAPCT